MAYSITTKDGITINGIPDDVAPDSPQLKARVAAIRGQSQPTVSDPSEGGLPFRPFGIDTGLTMPQGVSRFAAGAGKAMTDIARGAGQMVGLVSEDDIEEARQRDKPLMNTGAGVAGNVAGNLAVALPTAFIPGANTVTGGAAIGATMGALQPVGRDESRLTNTVTGGVAGGVIPAAVQGFKAAKAAIYDPLANQNRIIGGALKRSVGESEAQQVASALRSGNGAATPGVKLSAGTQSGNEGLAALEDSIGNQIPNSELARNLRSNNTILANRLRDIGQDDAALAAAKEAREVASERFYNAAKPNFVTPTPELQNILRSPAMNEAWKRAERIAANEGKRITLGANQAEQQVTRFNPLTMTNETVVIPATQQKLSVEGLHYLKMGIDDLVGDVSSGIGKTEQRAILGLKERFLNELDSLSPEYKAGREAFSQMSQPVNQMQIGQALANKLIPSTSGEIPSRLNYASLATAMRNPDQVAKTATKFSGAKMAKAMSPEQMQTIENVTSDASRLAEGIRLGMGSGSPTARRLTQGDMIFQHLQQEAPVTAKVLEIVGKIPGVNLATKGVSSLASVVSNATNANMLTKLDDLLANNPQMVGALIEKELARIPPTERQKILQALPNTLMISLPSIDAAQKQ